MASPHVCGLAAYLIGTKLPAIYSSPGEIAKDILAFATRNSRVSPALSGTTSLIAFNGN
jgi:hypothetical protein